MTTCAHFARSLTNQPTTAMIHRPLSTSLPFLRAAGRPETPQSCFDGTIHLHTSQFFKHPRTPFSFSLSNTAQAYHRHWRCRQSLQQGPGVLRRPKRSLGCQVAAGAVDPLLHTGRGSQGHIQRRRRGHHAVAGRRQRAPPLAAGGGQCVQPRRTRVTQRSIPVQGIGGGTCVDAPTPSVGGGFVAVLPMQLPPRHS